MKQVTKKLQTVRQPHKRNIILIKISNYPKDKIVKIIDYASLYEYRLSKGRRDIIHVETFIENVVNILK